MSALGNLASAAFELHQVATVRGHRGVAKEARRIVKAAAALERPAPVVGAVLKAAADDRYLLCVAYSAHKMPAMGADKRIDLASPRALEKACWRFALHGFKVGVDHRPGGESAARVVENWVHRGPDWVVTGPDGTTEVVKAGDWLVGLILSPAAWRDYRQGRFGGVSMQGTATRKAPSKATLARVKE